ncbi:MAG: hypothetical protein HXY35_16520 [Chloroflexi bacterium]|nr:hypothetical protein [Chloroflexota bacterium]
MVQTRKQKILLVMTAFVLLLNACGGASQNQSEIATAVAQTVQAQNSLTEAAQVPTFTAIPPTLASDATTTPATDVILPTSTATLAPNLGCTLSANLIQEDPPDGTIYKPGETFYKRWWLQNTGTCTWDKTYKLVFWDGDLMGGSASYSLPEVVAPGETKEIPILLQAPTTLGETTGYWRLRSPWGFDFGVGPTSQSFYVQIIVSDSTEVEYGVTSVTYSLERDPLAGCPTNVRYKATAVITTNGPAKVQYYWRYSDGGKTSKETLNFNEAGSKTVTATYTLLAKANSGERWMRIVILSPVYREWEPVTFIHNCQ